ncbi:AfsA-related hotdog domain-containing protein [Pseudomonas sp. NyZ480]|uniref:AfsA-related hotdog domain-containing protein n=1 Tax=Pseudomonas sp. NyZ480 TaxID=3035289 RepID=UPI0024090D95|nr:AfsA-related hotdog domain-containing protein [Pseudomonas sp. NyZ480]WEZ89205.1 AfsA-related hotdog domain-containing protein [Pseudomonas sp. NyZ480]
MDRQLPLTPQVLHKGTAEDVLLSEFQDLLPARLTCREVERLQGELDPAGLTALHHAYREDARQGWVLASLPASLSETDFAVLGGFEMNVQGFYALRDGVYHLAAPWLPRQVELYLQRHFGLPAVDQAQVALLADRLHVLPGWERANLSSYTVLNDTNNYFFYNKPHEHVPGLMLIEVARQAMYHYFYSHSGYRRGDVSISIEDLAVSFNNYTESTYAVEVVVQHSAGQKRHQPRTVDKTAMFYQNGSLVTTLRLRGSAMKMPLFKRMRTVNFPEHHWFAPSNRVLPQVLLGMSDGSSVEGRLEHVSLRGVRFTAQLPHAASSVRQLSIYVRDSGFLSFAIAAVHPSRQEGVQLAMFAKLDRATLSTLKEVIKCHCFHEPLLEYAAVADASNDPLASPCVRQSV